VTRERIRSAKRHLCATQDIVYIEVLRIREMI